VTYSIETWDSELQNYTPQEGVPSKNLNIHQLRRSMRMLRNMGYSVHRKGVDRENNDASVLIETETRIGELK